MKRMGTEKGFTLIEMLIALGIMGVIGAAIVMTTATIVTITPQSNNQVITLRQVQNAGYWICRDVQMAQTVDISPPEFLELTFTEFVGGVYTDITVTYQLQDMPSGMKRLMRTRQGTSMLVADDIYYNVGDPDTSTKIISYQDNKLSVRITAQSGDATVIRKYEASQRMPTT